MNALIRTRLFISEFLLSTSLEFLCFFLASSSPHLTLEPSRGLAPLQTILCFLTTKRSHYVAFFSQFLPIELWSLLVLSSGISILSSPTCKCFRSLARSLSRFSRFNAIRAKFIRLIILSPKFLKMQIHLVHVFCLAMGKKITRSH